MRHQSTIAARHIGLVRACDRHRELLAVRLEVLDILERIGEQEIDAVNWRAVELRSSLSPGGLRKVRLRHPEIFGDIERALFEICRRRKGRSRRLNPRLNRLARISIG